MLCVDIIIILIIISIVIYHYYYSVIIIVSVIIIITITINDNSYYHVSSKNLVRANIVASYSSESDDEDNELTDEDLCDEGAPMDVERHESLKCSCTTSYIVTSPVSSYKYYDQVI